MSESHTTGVTRDESAHAGEKNVPHTTGVTPSHASSSPLMERADMLHTTGVTRVEKAQNAPCAEAAPADSQGEESFDRIGALYAAAEKKRASCRRASSASAHAPRRRLASVILRALVYVGAALTAAVLLFIVGYILVNGIPYLTPSLFEWQYTSDNVSLMPALVNTLIMAACALLIAVPIGVGSAIYLVEYAKRGNRFVQLVRVTTETLQGIPSIIYGLFGMLFFVTALKWGLSLLAGACTLAIMVLPVIMRTTEEALLAVPDAYREGGFGLGAGRLRTVFRCVMPSAVPGILGGVILALGRCVGEVAALIFTAGSIAAIPNFGSEGVFALFDSTRTLAVHMYVLASEGLHVNETYATAVVLLVVVVLLNSLATFAAKKMNKGSNDD